MGVSSQNPSPPPPPHLYSQELQLKLYQAFIFSIPILFSIILLLLFYLFYLKRRVSTLYSPPPPRPLLPTTSGHTPTISDMALKGDLKDNLAVVIFDEDLRVKDTQCCICLGQFEMEEEVNQVPSCKHVFHIDCITHWLLHSNSTCPLCRSPIFIISTSLS